MPPPRWHRVDGFVVDNSNTIPNAGYLLPRCVAVAEDIRATRGAYDILVDHYLICLSGSWNVDDSGHFERKGLAGISYLIPGSFSVTHVDDVCTPSATLSPGHRKLLLCSEVDIRAGCKCEGGHGFSGEAAPLSPSHIVSRDLYPYCRGGRSSRDGRSSEGSGNPTRQKCSRDRQCRYFTDSHYGRLSGGRVGGHCRRAPSIRQSACQISRVARVARLGVSSCYPNLNASEPFQSGHRSGDGPGLIHSCRGHGLLLVRAA